MRSTPRYGSGPIRIHEDYCDYCGCKWPRDKMVRDASGKLRCPKEGSGLDALALDRMNARAVATMRPVQPWRKER